MENQTGSNDSSTSTFQGHLKGLKEDPVLAWKMGAHVAAVLGIIPVFRILAFVGPLLIWKFKKDLSPEVMEEARESMNFQLSVLVYSVPFNLIVAAGGSGSGAVRTFLEGLSYLVFNFGGCLVLPVFAAYQIYRRRPYRYPFNLRWF